MEYIFSFRHPILVFGADTEELVKEVAQLTELNVELLDFRNRACPPLPDRMVEICQEGGVVLIAFDRSPETRWLLSLLTDLLPPEHSWARSATQLDVSKVFIVISTSARLLDEIDHWKSLEDVLRRAKWVFHGDYSEYANKRGEC
jgi:hypothetical protein